MKNVAWEIYVGRMEEEIVRNPFIPVGTTDVTHGVVKCRLEVTETACDKGRIHISIVNEIIRCVEIQDIQDQVGHACPCSPANSEQWLRPGTTQRENDPQSESE